MKKIKIFFTLLGSVAFLGFQSCLDYDIPTDDFDQTEIKVDDTIYRGAADSIDYMKSISEEGYRCCDSGAEHLFQAGSRRNIRDAWRKRRPDAWITLLSTSVLFRSG